MACSCNEGFRSVKPCFCSFGRFKRVFPSNICGIIIHFYNKLLFTTNFKNMKILFKLAVLFFAIVSMQSCKKEPPMFEISASSKHIVVGESITFTYTGDNDTQIEWLLQGSTTPTGNTSTITTTYNTFGTYNVSAIVTKNGLSATKTLTIQVEAGTWYYQFPGGQSNNNSTIGDFCCTGQTITISNYAGKPLGYAYFFSWNGNAYNLPDGTSIAPNFEIGISGADNLEGNGTRAISKVFFPAESNIIGATRTVKIGKLEYKVKILEIAYPAGMYNATHFLMGSLKVEVSVRWVP